MHLAVKAYCLAAFVSTLVLPSMVIGQSSSRPNIVVILVDDMGYSDLQPMGGEIATPHIAELAENGITFTSFYNSARCYPTRASLLTGRYQHSAGIGGSISRVDDPIEPGPYQGFLNESATLAEVLRSGGYRTYMSGKWHVGERPEHWPRRRGFDRYFGLISGASSYYEILKNQSRIRQMASDDDPWEPPPEGFYMTDALTDSALAFVGEHTTEFPDQPFLLYLAYTAPHWPLHAPEEDIALYEGRFDAGWDQLRTERHARMLESGILDGRHKLSPRPDDVPAWSTVADQDLWTRRMEVYAAMVHRVDQGVGRLIDLLKQTGQFDNTLILFLSDNGGCAEDVTSRGLNDPSVPIGARGSYDAYRSPWANLSNTPFRRYKATMFEGGIRTPLIAHWPAGIAEPGRRSIELGHVIDILPTLSDVTGIVAPKDVDGVSIAPVFRREHLSRPNLFWEHMGHRAMRAGDTKIVYTPESAAWELYDLNTDPTELVDLADLKPTLSDSLESLWELWARTRGVRFDDAEGEAQGNRSSTRPNMLVFVADDAGWNDFGAYGSDVARTPNIDQLAEEGLVFDQAMLTAPQCSPSRISILTGEYPHETGAEDLHMWLPQGEPILPAYLREAGYFTGHVLKTHYGPFADAQFDWYSKDLGDFNPFLSAAGEKPFFLWVGFTDPHRPYGNDGLRNLHGPEQIKVPAHLVDTPGTRRDFVDYLDEIARMDSVIGAYLQILDERNALENTLVVFLSDNGAPFPRAKGTLYDAGIKTPLIFRQPNRIPASRSPGLVSVIDLAPTLLDIAGLEAPPEMWGRSLADAFQNPDSAGTDYVFSERNWHNCDEHMRSVRSERYKLIQNAYLDVPHCTAADISSSPSWQDLAHLRDAGALTPAQQRLFEVPRPEFELYDLAADPDEYINLAGDPDHAAVLEELKSRLEAWKAETNDFPHERRRRGDNTDRYTGVKFTEEIPDQIE